MSSVLEEIEAERKRQAELGWDSDHDDQLSSSRWFFLTDDYLNRAVKASLGSYSGSKNSHRQRLIQVAALIVAWVESLDRKNY